jgi:hypothetical protein
MSRVLLIPAKVVGAVLGHVGDVEGFGTDFEACSFDEIWICKL